MDVIFHPEITIDDVCFGDCSRAWMGRAIRSACLPLLFLKKNPPWLDCFWPKEKSAKTYFRRGRKGTGRLVATLVAVRKRKKEINFT